MICSNDWTEHPRWMGRKGWGFWDEVEMNSDLCGMSGGPHATRTFGSPFDITSIQHTASTTGSGSLTTTESRRQCSPTLCTVENREGSNQATPLGLDFHSQQHPCPHRDIPLTSTTQCARPTPPHPAYHGPLIPRFTLSPSPRSLLLRPQRRSEHRR